MIKVDSIKAFKDNYIWVLRKDLDCIIIDPGNSQPVFDFLKRTGLHLQAILITHTHPDHIDGVLNLFHEFPSIRIYASKHCHLYYATHNLEDKETFTELGVLFEFWHTPGHLKNHGVFWLDKIDSLFCGDTLFSLGCGRIFDGTMDELYLSLQRIKHKLKTKEWLIYPTHEYTMSNLGFVESLSPQQEDLLKLRESLEKSFSQQTGTLPTTAHRELKYNPFLNSTLEEFKILRLNRNTWKAHDPIK